MPDDIIWTRCTGNATCVEVGYTACGPLSSMILVRDSKDPGGPMLEFTPEEWRAFIDGVRDGLYDV
jgi:hypothetical protein